MPLRLHVGVSRKVGLPEFSSAGASCHLELELPEGLFQSDLDEFQRRVRDAYVAARQAVEDELSQLRDTPPAPVTSRNGTHASNGNGSYVNGSTAPRANGGRPRKPATTSQVRAIESIARRQRADLSGLLRDDFGVTRPEDLSLSEASRLIDALKAAADV